MKALLCTKLGPPESLVLTEGLPSPKPGSGEVLVKVLVAGINFPDTLIIEGKYQFKPELPFAPGGEAVGRVIALGEGVTGLAIGDRVVAMNVYGMLAEEVCVSSFQLVKLPDASFTDAEAAGFLIAYGTTYYALNRRAGLSSGQTLAVLGAAGGVGLAAVQLGKAMGAKVIACASTDAKLEVCKANGADVLINTSNQKLKDALKAATHGDGVDVVYDPVGGTQTEEALRAMAWGGRLLVIGFASGTIPQLPVNLTLLKSCSVVGVFWGAYTAREPEHFKQDLAELLELKRAGKVKPLISGTFPLARGGEAIRQLADRKAVGKVVVTVA
ncbi:MAG: NADPH:quinone oxidoreductase family protein [Deltaproteobacteria bacterium]|nr:NADPH:quinone oxidoreductase family protein [Deltaproteobacteria bacterium]